MTHQRVNEKKNLGNFSTVNVFLHRIDERVQIDEKIRKANRFKTRRNAMRCDAKGESQIKLSGNIFVSPSSRHLFRLAIRQTFRQ